jgi:hypothetical protein
MPGHCNVTDRDCCEGEACHEWPANACTGHCCEDYHGYPVEDDREIGWDEPDDEDEGRALGFIETYPRTEE